MKGKTYIIMGLVIVALALLLAACSQAEATPCPTAAPCPECATCPPEKTCPTCPTCPTCETCEVCVEPLVKDVPFAELWSGSGHNAADTEAFRHWDGETPPEVPASCAKCHSSYGYLDFLGADGSAAGTVDANHPVDSTINCATCHNDATKTKSSVVFPSGAEITGLDASAICMECHQGRASKVSVDAAIEKAAITDADTVSADLGFINIHYYAAGATLFGAQAMGGYQYEGMTYDGKFRHVEGIETCVGCHDTHSLEVKVETCAMCHEGVTTVEDLKNTRMMGSLADYDGDGDTTEGIASELAGLQEALYSAMKEYGASVAGTGIVYDAAAYPYFFADADGDGVADQAEGAAVSFTSWTARLLKAAYNYQTSLKDPGAFAHNAKYMIELLYDSIADLNAKLGTIDMSAMHRNDPGHFAGNTEAFRHWDAEGEVPGGCARCHSATGLPQFIHNGANVANETANGFMCTTCHDEANWPARYAVASVAFPSSKSVTFGENADANLCLLCHQGRESKQSVDTAIVASGAADANSLAAEGKRLGFRNVHYFAAGATLFGTEVQGAYEYDGKTYLGAHPHVAAGFTCSSCHDVHALEVKTATCAGCHPGKAPEEIRFATSTADFDGDGDTAEGIAGELETLAEALYAQLQAVAPVTYNAYAYPYFFDAEGQGFAAWTPRLLKAAYNYQYYQKDPGAFAHNGKYIIQVLIDSIEDLGGDVTGYTRP